MRKEWRVRDGIHEVLILRFGQVTSEERAGALSPHVASRSVETWFSGLHAAEPFTSFVLQDLCAELGAVSLARPLARGHQIRRVSDALARGALVAIERRRAPLSWVPEPPVAPPAPRPAAPVESEDKGWIEIALVDEDGAPIAGQAYCIELPDGEKREGKLDGGGKLRLDHLVPGSCKVTFPEIDGPDLKRSAA